MGHTLIRLLPQLRAGGLIVAQRIIGIVELIQHPALAACRHRLRQIARPFHSLLTRHQYQLCAIGTHRILPLLTHVVRHQQAHTIAFHRGDHRQRNAGVATGGFDQLIAG